MTSYHPTIFPVKAGSTFLLNQADDYQQSDLTIYQRLIEKFLYLSCGTHPDIIFIVGQLSCHNLDPWTRHLRIAKQVLRYLKKTITQSMEWENDPAGHQSGGKYGELGVVRYTDSSYAGNLEDKKLIIGYCFFFSRAIVTWCSKRQRTVSISTPKAEYVAVSQSAREEVWI